MPINVVHALFFASTARGRYRGKLMSQWAFGSSEKVVLCCSSTYHRRYVDDLVQVMSLPKGARVRLRYREPYCQPELRGLGEAKPLELPRMPALIAHVGFNGLKAEYLPLRTGTVVELLTEGSVTYLEVELGDFVEEPVGSTFADTLPLIAGGELPHKASPDAKPEGFFFQTLQSPPILKCGSDTKIWERVAEKFLAAVARSSIELPFIFGFSVVEKSTRKLLPYSVGTLVAPPIRELELHIRTLASAFAVSSSIQSRVGSLELSVEHPHCQLSLGTHLAIDAPRNLFVSRLSTSIGFRKAYGKLTVVARYPMSGSHTSQELASPDQPTEAMARGIAEDQIVVDLPIRVGPSQLVRLGLALIVAMGLGAHAFDVDQYGDEKWLVLGKASAVMVAALCALLIGLKPEANE